MFWSKLCKSSWNCRVWNLAFPVFVSPVVWNMCENLHYESVYFKKLHNQQEYYWPTIYRTGTAVVSTITSLVLRLNKDFSFYGFLRKSWICACMPVSFFVRECNYFLLCQGRGYSLWWPIRGGSARNLARVASVSNRVIARKLEREQRKRWKGEGRRGKACP